MSPVPPVETGVDGGPTGFATVTGRPQFAVFHLLNFWDELELDLLHPIEPNLSLLSLHPCLSTTRSVADFLSMQS